MPWFAVGLAVLFGIAFAQQPAINSAVVRVLGTPVAAAVFSVSITLICLLVLLPFAGGSIRPQLLSTLPWWALFGGFAGVLIVAGGAFLAPVLGAALFFACLVAGQLLGAAVADHLGAFGLPVRSISPLRIAGLVLVFLGALLIHRG